MKDQIRCISPVDGSVYAEHPIAGTDDVARALRRARTAQVDWSRSSVENRARLCSAVVDAMLAMRDEIVPELAWQMGRPVRFGSGELDGFEERARHMIAIAQEALSPVTLPERSGLRRFIRREPLGLLFVIAPWNYPYLTSVNSIIPGLMAGNAVVLKHASQTLLVGERFQTACDRAGLPQGLFTNLVLSHGQAGQIITGKLVDRVHFTGSVEAGRTIERAAGGAFVGVGLELGGKDPAYVRADADTAHAVEQLLDGAFFNSGQSCCGVERIYVEEKVFHQFVDAFVEASYTYILDDPLKPETTLGPMISPGAADFVRSQISDAEKKGARALVDASRWDLDAPGSAYMAPQVVVDVDHGMPLMRDESFGPVVGIMPVPGDQEAVQLMNDSAFGLTASIWTSDIEAAERIGQDIETGTVYMNRCDYLDPALAWTGVKDTGRGATLSEIGYECLTRPKSYYLRYEL